MSDRELEALRQKKLMELKRLLQRREKEKRGVTLRKFWINSL